MRSNQSRTKESPLRKFAVCRGEAAALLDISTGTFDEWVRRGWMPKGVKLGTLRRWDAAEVRAFWYVLVERHRETEEDDSAGNPFDRAVG